MNEDLSAAITAVRAATMAKDNDPDVIKVLLDEIAVDQVDFRAALGEETTLFLEGMPGLLDLPTEIMLKAWGIHWFLIGAYYASRRGR